MTLLIAASMGVAAAHGQGTPTKSPSPKSGSKPHHSKSGRKVSARARGQKAPEPSRVSEIQTALAKDGSFPGKPNGKWDSDTVDAMKRFQESHGLNPTGKLDAKTLQKLGLGSQTAGVAPPMPPVSSSSLDSTATKPAIRK